MCCIVVECARGTTSERSVQTDSPLLEQVPDDRHADRVTKRPGQAGELLVGRRDRQASARPLCRARGGSPLDFDRSLEGHPLGFHES